MNQENQNRNYINYINDKIIDYTNEVMKMVVPENASPEEKDIAFNVLSTTTAMNVYMENFRNILSNHNIDYQGQIPQLWFALDNVSPTIHPKKVLSQPKDFSRYGGKQWRNGKEGISILEPQKLLKLVVKKLKRSEPEKNFLEAVTSRPQVRTALAMRDIFYNGSTMEAFNLDSPKFREISRFVHVMQAELQRFYHDPQTFFPYMCKSAAFREEEYIKVNGKLSQFLSTSKLKSIMIADDIEWYKKQNLKADTKEFRKIAETVMEICESHFVDLPKNPNQHEAYLKRLTKIIEQDVLNNPNLKRTNVEMYSQYTRELYQKYMQKMRNGTLPLRMSYYPEDKARYKSIVENVSAFQEYRRDKYEKRKEERRNWDSTVAPEKIVLASFIGVAVATIPFLASTITNDYTIPIVQAVGTISALALRKIATQMNLYRDVEKRFSIKNIRVLPYWLDKRVNPEKYNYEKLASEENLGIDNNSELQTPNIEAYEMPYSYGQEPSYKYTHKRNRRANTVEK